MASDTPQGQDESTQLVSEYLASGKDFLSAVIFGKLGAGKSSLVNGLVGRIVAKEGLSPVSETSDITPYEAKIDVSLGTRVRPIQTTILDTPGCADVFEEEATREANLEKIAKKTQEADLLLYCMKMCDRLTTDDVIGIEEMTKRIGPEVWKNAILVLTFANEVKPPPGDAKDKLEYFEEIFSAWQKQLRMVLAKKILLPESIVESISIVPTGYRQTPPPDREDWLSAFWFEAFLKTKESAQPALLGINLHRLRIQSPYQAKAAAGIPQEKQLEAHQQTININPKNLGKTEGVFGGSVGRMALNAIFKSMEQAVGQAVQKLSQKLLSQAIDTSTNRLIPTVATAVLAASGWQIATAGLVVGAAGLGVGALVYAVVAYKARKKVEAKAAKGQVHVHCIKN